MTITVNVHEAKTHLSRLLEQAHAGEEIILAKAGKPYARLVPLLAVPSPRRPGRLCGQIDTTRFFDPLPPDELDAWEGR
jgi:prevent-host-death family protein